MQPIRELDRRHNRRCGERGIWPCAPASFDQRFGFYSGNTGSKIISDAKNGVGSLPAISRKRNGLANTHRTVWSALARRGRSRTRLGFRSTARTASPMRLAAEPLVRERARTHSVPSPTQSCASSARRGVQLRRWQGAARVLPPFFRAFAYVRLLGLCWRSTHNPLDYTSPRA